MQILVANLESDGQKYTLISSFNIPAHFQWGLSIWFELCVLCKVSFFFLSSLLMVWLKTTTLLILMSEVIGEINKTHFLFCEYESIISRTIDSKIKYLYNVCVCMCVFVLATISIQSKNKNFNESGQIDKNHQIKEKKQTECNQ